MVPGESWDSDDTTTLKDLLTVQALGAGTGISMKNHVFCPGGASTQSNLGAKSNYIQYGVFPQGVLGDPSG